MPDDESKFVDLYSFIGSHYYASQEEVDAAIESSVNEWSTSWKARGIVADMQQLVRLAANVLGNPESREKYDKIYFIETGRADSFSDYYEFLGIEFNASTQEIKDAWRAAVKHWHPDRNKSPDAAKGFKVATNCWKVLGDPVLRSRCDKEYVIAHAVAADFAQSRSQQFQAQRKEREAAAKAEAEAQRRAEEAARKRREQEQREQERREREAKRAADRRRKQEERDRKARAKREAEAERRRRFDDRFGRRANRRREPAGAGGGSSVGGNRGGRRSGGWPWVFIGAVLLLPLLLIGALFLIANWPDSESDDEPRTALVRPTATSWRPTSTPVPRIIRVTATPAPRATATPIPRIVYVTPTRAPTPRPTVIPANIPRPTPSPLPTSTPIPRATASPTPDPDLAWLDSIETGSVHEYLIQSDNPSADDIRRLVANGAPFGYIDEIGFGTLMLAVAVEADYGVFAALLEAGDDPRQNPLLLHLLMTSESPTVDVLQLLIGAGANLLAVDFNGETPIEVAWRRGDEIPEQVVDALSAATLSALDLTATPEPEVVQAATATPAPTRTPVPTATVTKTPTRTAQLDATATPRRQFEGSPTVLHNLLGNYSVSLDQLRLLVDAGAPLNTVDFIGRTPLEVAAQGGHGNAVFRVLIDAGADVRASKSVLHNLLGNYSVSVEALRLLVDAGAPLNTVDFIGRTPLEVAAQGGHSTAVFAVLIDAGADVRASKSVLHNLLGNYSVTIGALQLLIEAGAPLNTVDFIGRTPLEVAAQGGHGVGVFALLIDAGADVRASKSVLHSLLGNYSVSIDALRLLIEAGAPLNTVDFIGRTPLEVAAQGGHGAEILGLLVP